jgi:hypothetical protein
MKAENLAYGGNHWQEIAIGAPGEMKRFVTVTATFPTRDARVMHASTR